MLLHTNKHLVCEYAHLLAITYYLCLLLGGGGGGGGFGVGAITGVVVVTVVAIIVILILIVAIVVLTKRRLVLVSCLTHCHLLHLSSVLLNAKLFFLCEHVTVRNMVFAASLLQRL